MKRTLSLIFTLLTLFCYGQSWTWAKSSHGTGSGDEGWATSVDNHGNVFVTGFFSSSTISFGTYTLTNSGSVDIFLVKYDANGNVLWAKGAGGTNLDYSYSVCTDTLGNAFITGVFSTTITFGTYTITGGGIFITKYDPNGNVIWVKYNTGNGSAVGNAITSDIKGNVYITGTFSGSNLIFGTTTLTNPCYPLSTLFITKLDSNGNLLWAKNPSKGACSGNSIAVDKTGNAFITGSTSFGDSLLFDTCVITFASGTQNTFLAKYNSGGMAVWVKNSVGASCVGNSVSADPNGNALVTGYFSNAAVSFGTYTLSSTGSHNPFTTKYDSVGNVLWARTAVSSGGNDQAYSISVDKYGYSFVTGGFSYASTITFGSYTLSQSNAATDPMFLVNYDPNGNVVYATSLSSGGDDKCGLFTDTNCNTYIAGDFQALNFAVGTTTLVLSTTGGEDVFVAKLSYNCQLEDIIQTENINSSIYPNPTNGSFNLKTTVEGCQIIIFNLTGQTIHSQILFLGLNNIEMYGLPAGLYNYQLLQNGRNVGVGKVVVK